MITRIEIDGFKTFEDFSLDVPPFLVLLGQNGSGKSNLFEAISLLGHLVEEPSSQTVVRHARRGGPQGLFRRGPDGALAKSVRIAATVVVDIAEHGRCPLSVEARIGYREAPEPLEVDLDIRTDGAAALMDAVQRWHALREAVAGWRILDLLPDALRLPADPYDQDPLAEDGHNLGAVMGRVWASEESRTRYQADVAALLPDIAAIDVVRESERAQWEIWIQHRHEPRMSPRVVSGGTLRVLGLLAAAHDPAHPGVLMVEELENGLYPNRVPRLLHRLTRCTTDPAGPDDRTPASGSGARQIIVTSHSPVVLSSVLEEAPHDVLFLDTVTRVRRGLAPTRITRGRMVAESGERGSYVTPMEVGQYLDPVGYARGT
ncbi:AAA family ATPase [Streptomyces sp. NA04227]|uniref:AAA family ATPase n=1 Tax=Streptomyces sp. NA04227 TaxID=2742136 RepID=UPI00158FE193|nr:AAA family ATPase [Streptomyces sp. NA04227]QKW09347.1 AAA family ATPase [Streptomyces sp. NA04227]